MKIILTLLLLLPSYAFSDSLRTKVYLGGVIHQIAKTKTCTRHQCYDPEFADLLDRGDNGDIDAWYDLADNGLLNYAYYLKKISDLNTNQSSDSQLRIGLLFHSGLLGDKNRYQNALKHYELSASHGNLYAKHNIGVLFSEGRLGGTGFNLGDNRNYYCLAIKAWQKTGNFMPSKQAIADTRKFLRQFDNYC